ncbi:MAG: hypothetical protein IBJ16_09715 [Chitinophagaceae bacterium]|nr:hypothetical protein [Chitinophagaceae bacterium]
MANTKLSLYQYGSGQSLPVFMDNDHIRFSIFLSFAALFAWYIRKQHKYITLLLFFLITSILFLSVRTGWASLLLMSFALFLHYLLTQAKQKIRALILYSIATILILITAWFIFPSIQQKIAYSFYDWGQISSHTFNANLSDATRYSLNKTGWNLIQTGNTNIGWSDIAPSMQKRFKVLYPGYATSFGWPFNQWLYWWIGSGSFGMLLFTLWLFFPVLIGFQQKNIGLIIGAVAVAISCLVEVNLAYQYGVWLHVWGIGLLWLYNFTKPDIDDKLIRKNALFE